MTIGKLVLRHRNGVTKMEEQCRDIFEKWRAEYLGIELSEVPERWNNFYMDDDWQQAWHGFEAGWKARSMRKSP